MNWKKKLLLELHERNEVIAYKMFEGTNNRYFNSKKYKADREVIFEIQKKLGRKVIA